MLETAYMNGGSALVSDTANRAPGTKGKRRRRDVENANGSIGRALRTVYQQAVDERVPDDMLELLRKLD
ncbi:NepR family anti-sigma factor [Sphingomonas flavalba]|uniref:NepR family anti-sigma factor n=1 Tax=Sphingomonas flavalba TaxID=2559804 RepID=UPI00109E143B|nr:NepR family anti-sigma factor [Sphingomonas flavalba]